MKSVKGIVLAVGWLLALTSASVHADQKVFRCEFQGTVTYSDKACDKAADKTEVATGSLNSYSVEDTTKRSVHSATPKRVAHSSDSIAEAQIRHKERCKDFNEQLASIEEKIWNDSSGRKQEAHLDRLREQQRKLERQRSTEKCR